ncbi:MAG: hypothetical protein IPM82_29865 [Saprospiraceae bacterium]|nr:hypothetical protein [Saprospiraceae bacterium]
MAGTPTQTATITTRYPSGAVEIPDNIHNDCDAHVDEGVADTDNDGILDADDNCPLVSNPGQENSDSPDGLVFSEMNEGAGNSINSSNSAATGSLESSPEWVPGHVGTALQFNGSNQYVTANFPLQGASQATLAAWVKTSVNQAGSYFLSVPMNSGGNNGFDLSFNGAGVIQCCIVTSRW